MMVYSIAEFAKAHGVTRQAVWQWIAKTPGFRPKWVGPVVILTEADCKQILNRPRQKMGRPRKAPTLDT